MIYLGVKIHIFEVLSNSEFTKIIQYPEYKSANISDREKVMVQEKEEGNTREQSPWEGQEWLDPEYKQRGWSQIQAGILFFP